MDQPWERRISATGTRLHWVRPGDLYALCGSRLVDDGRALSAALADCDLCARKYAKAVARRSDTH